MKALKIGLMAIFISGCGLTGAHKEEAEKQATAWAKQMGLQDAKVSCVSNDTDGDGYVSCTVASADKIHSIECTGAMTINEGCRVPKLRSHIR